jgi:hypothetical protein
VLFITIKRAQMFVLLVRISIEESFNALDLPYLEYLLAIVFYIQVV